MTTIDTALTRLGSSRSTLMRDSEAVILFGSRAADMAGPTSDWDLLIVGSGRSRVSRHLDLIFIDPAAFTGPRWRRSELAAHVGCWGRTLSGSKDWLESLRGLQPHDDTLAAKRRRLLVQLAAAERFWPKLAPWARARRVQQLRRDLQRYAWLRDGRPVPPTRMLDQEWFEAPRGCFLRGLIERARIRDHVGWLEAEFGSIARSAA